MGDYLFKRGRLRSLERWAVSESELIGPVDRVDLGRASNARFSIAPVGRGFFTVQMIFELDGRNTSFSCTDTLHGGDLSSCLALASEVAETYGRLQVGATFATTRGERIQTWGLTVIAAAIVAAGLYKIAALWLSGRIDGFGVGLWSSFVLVGLLLLWASSPWKKHPPKTATEVCAWIDRVRAL